MSEEAGAPASATRADHVQWLRAERAAFEQHEARVGKAPGPVDFAVGSEGFVNMDDEEPVYRSISLMAPTEDDDLVYDDEPVYRSLDLGQLPIIDPKAKSYGGDAHASWAKQQRPPLLRRQNAFAFDDSDPEWLGILDATTRESNR